VFVFWHEHQLLTIRNKYDQKKKVQSSGRLCFSNRQKKIRPEKKVQLSDRRLEWISDNHLSCQNTNINYYLIQVEKITTGKKGTVVWFRIPHMPPAGSWKVLHAPVRWGGIWRASQTKIYNLETDEFISNPPFSKKRFGGSNIATPVWREQLE
jgi:hypothetical protein